jgi:hypothetical protein
MYQSNLRFALVSSQLIQKEYSMIRCSWQALTWIKRLGKVDRQGRISKPAVSGGS